MALKHFFECVVAGAHHKIGARFSVTLVVRNNESLWEIWAHHFASWRNPKIQAKAFFLGF